MVTPSTPGDPACDVDIMIMTEHQAQRGAGAKGAIDMKREERRKN